MLRRQSVLSMKDFSGGLVTRGSELSLNPHQTPDCVNVHTDIFKSVTKRLGYLSHLTSPLASATAYGIYNFRRDATTQHLLTMWEISNASALRRIDISTGAWVKTAPTSLSAHANLGTNLTHSEFLHFTSFGSDCIITTEGGDVPQKYDSTATYPTITANYTDIDWENTHCEVVGNVSAVTPNPLITKSYLKITIDGTEFDDVDCDGDTSIADVAASINAHTALAAKGFAYVDSDGYLRIVSNTRGITGSVVVADGSNDDQECCEILFDGVTVTGTTITATELAPSGKYNAIWQNYLWIANTSALPDSLFYSNAVDPTTWASASDYVTIKTPGDIGITGLAVMRGRLYVFKKWSIHRVTYLGGTPLLDVSEVKSTVGTSSPRTIRNVEIPGEGEVLIFLGSDSQLYKFDGYNSTPISEAISTYNGISTYCMIGDGTNYGINPATLAQCHSVDYARRHHYILWFCKDNDTTPKDGIVWDYFANTFWPVHLDQDGSDIFNVSCISDDGAGQRKCYTAGLTNLYLWDTGNTDDAGNIDAYWVSSKLDLGSEVVKKDIRNINLTMNSTVATPKFQYRCDWESAFSTAQTLVASTREHTYDIPRFEEIFQFKFRDDSTAAAFELIRATLIAEKIGMAK